MAKEQTSPASEGTSLPPALVVILAGGQGTRFWPVSRTKRPKQFFSVSPTGESLIQATARRLEPLLNGGELMVVTNIIHRPLVEEHLPAAKALCEPVGRNTAPSIGLAALYARRINPDAVMVVVPADHAIADEAQLRGAISAGVRLAAGGERLVTIGIQPTSPHTGYGYIKRGIQLSPNGFQVARFFEKPNLERATQYVKSGDYLWNSGMFCWTPGAILAAIKEHMPALAAGLDKIDAAIGTKHEQPVLTEVFESFESISIDFGVLEHARNCAVVAAEPFGWSDVGSWDAWAEHFPPDSNNNILKGETIAVDSTDCIVFSEKRLTAVVGAKDLIVIDTGDAVLVCPRDRVQDVRKVVDELKRRGRTDLV